MIKANSHKYSISATCIVLQIPRSTYYYESKKKQNETELAKQIKEIFTASRRNYGTRRIKHELKRKNKQISRRRIARIMKELGLVSNYTIANYKPQRKASNEEQIANELNREFKQEQQLAVVVTDLTYVRVAGKWNYICLLIDLYNREIIGHSVGANKDANLVYKALSQIKTNLSNICMLHSDRGLEFKNAIIDEALQQFGIKRSLSAKGTPLDNSVAEAAYKTLKVEFVYSNRFNSLEELSVKLDNYIYWYNNKRLHSTLGYMSPIEYKNKNKNIAS